MDELARVTTPVQRSTNAAVATSISHLAVGIGVGSMIELITGPPAADASVGVLAFEAAVQVGLNGVALAVLGQLLTRDANTYGIPFSMGLVGAQPRFAERIDLLSASVKRQLDRGARKTWARVGEACTPNSETGTCGPTSDPMH